MGVVSPCGNTLNAFWDNITRGRGGVGRLTRFDPEPYASQVAGEVKEFDATEFIDRKALRHTDRFVKYAWVASLEAYRQAGLTETNIDGNRLAVIIGSGIGGIETLEVQHQVLMERGPSRVSPFFVPMMISDMASGQLSIVFGAKGPNFCTVSACASGAHAIGEAYRLVCEGYSDAVLAGGAESPLTPLALAGFCSMKALSTRNDSPETASRPFDKDRDGFVMAEGAATLVLEEWEFARARGADILAELIGYASTADAYHVTAPEPNGEGAARAMKLAVASAGISLEAVEYINAHGTSTPLNDRGETLAIRSVFGAHADRLMVSSTKSMTGHLLGAAGAVESAATVMALREGLIPPTINHEVPGEDCDLDYVVGQEARERKISVALSNSLGFGGHNVSLLFRAV
jgi:3-oxoacyl-[acyl-carrier-protein] synthase II